MPRRTVDPVTFVETETGGRYEGEDFELELREYTGALNTAIAGVRESDTTLSCAMP